MFGKKKFKNSRERERERERDESDVRFYYTDKLSRRKCFGTHRKALVPLITKWKKAKIKTEKKNGMNYVIMKL